jgi:hypothetical protein
VALGTTAPEGSVTWPRKVPVVVDDGADDCVGDCAEAGATSPITVAGIKIAEMKTNKYFNTHPILSRQIALIDNTIEI